MNYENFNHQSNLISNRGYSFNNDTNHQNNSTNKKVITIIIAVVGLLLIIFGATKIFGGNSSSGNGYTVSRNQTLNIKETVDGQKDFYNFSLKVDSIEENYKLEDGLSYTRLRLTITNNSTTPNNNLLLFDFSLLDSNNEILETTNILKNGSYAISTYGAEEATLLSVNELGANETVSGYLYFKNASSDINKLEIQVPISGKDNGEELPTLTYESYYINLR